MLTAGGAAFAQDNRDEIIQKLLDRVDVLEREVAALQQKPGPAAVQPAPIEDVPSVNSAPSDPGSRFNFHGYADAGFVRNDDGGSTKKFDLGEIDLFATERLSAHLTALMEVVLETNNQQLVAQVPLNVERLLLQYRGNDF